MTQLQIADYAPFLRHPPARGRGEPAPDPGLARAHLPDRHGDLHILSMQDGEVTFRYQEGATHQTKSCTLPAEVFIQRFLAHILPKGIAYEQPASTAAPVAEVSATDWHTFGQVRGSHLVSWRLGDCLSALRAASGAGWRSSGASGYV